MNWSATPSWIKAGLQTAQKHAQEAAERAAALAKQATASDLVSQAKALAGQAVEKGKVLAAAAAEEAQHKLQELQAAATSSQSRVVVASPEDLARYGVTNEVVEYVSSMTYSTFSDYPLESLATTSAIGLHAGAEDGDDFRLSPWQEKHCMLILQKVNQLQNLRFALCPKRMTEQQFWTIYFTLTKRLMPPEAFGLAPTPASTSQQAPQPSATKGDQASEAVAAAAAAAAAAGAVSALPSSATTAAAEHPAVDRSISSEAEAELIDALSGTVDDDDDDDDDDDLDKLAELENDPELAAYLQEALNVDEGGEGEESGSGSGVDDLDDYINQLDAEFKDSPSKQD